MRTSDFDYELPAELIAQHPLPERTQARMMVVHRSGGYFEHRRVVDLPDYLQRGDLLVVNDTRVIPARVVGTKAGTGGGIEVLFLEEVEAGRWDALCRASRRPKEGTRLVLANGKIRARVVAHGPDGRISLQIESDRPLLSVLEEEGLPPLPPYIKRPKGPTSEDRQRYQTVYARSAGAVAAPTAGMHLTMGLLDELAGRGIRHAAITLHVGIGTFKPVTTEAADEHVMESERYAITGQAASLINETQSAGGRVVAVGSTTVRTLETVAAEHGRIVPCEGRTGMFIRPPYEFRAVGTLLTNFHLPKSTLIMMVGALAGREMIMRAYAEAIRERYRFYSYGDCMLIL